MYHVSVFDRIVKVEVLRSAYDDYETALAGLEYWVNKYGADEYGGIMWKEGTIDIIEY